MAKRNIRLHLYRADGSGEDYESLRFVCGANTDTILRVHRDDLADVLKAFKTGFWQVFFDEALICQIWKQAGRSSAAGGSLMPSAPNSSTERLT